jgi:hypothetical protein
MAAYTWIQGARHSFDTDTVNALFCYGSKWLNLAMEKDADISSSSPALIPSFARSSSQEPAPSLGDVSKELRDAYITSFARSKYF